jgi:molybdopterin converting factor small subunit
MKDRTMQVHVKLMASLRTKLPAGSAAGGFQLNLEPGTSIATALERLGIPSGHIHMVTVNREMEPDRDRMLKEGDELVVFPPVAGGASTPASLRRR